MHGLRSAFGRNWVRRGERAPARDRPFRPGSATGALGHVRSDTSSELVGADDRSSGSTGHFSVSRCQCQLLRSGCSDINSGKSGPSDRYEPARTSAIDPKPPIVKDESGHSPADAATQGVHCVIEQSIGRRAQAVPPFQRPLQRTGQHCGAPHSVVC